MVPKVGHSSMSSQTFEKMLFVTEKLFEKGSYDNATFRLSGGGTVSCLEELRRLSLKL
jgi:hypothetical protein